MEWNSLAESHSSWFILPLAINIQRKNVSNVFLCVNVLLAVFSCKGVKVSVKTIKYCTITFPNDLRECDPGLISPKNELHT